MRHLDSRVFLLPAPLSYQAIAALVVLLSKEAGQPLVYKRPQLKTLAPFISNTVINELVERNFLSTYLMAGYKYFSLNYPESTAYKQLDLYKHLGRHPAQITIIAILQNFGACTRTQIKAHCSCSKAVFFRVLESLLAAGVVVKNGSQGSKFLTYSLAQSQ